MLLLLSVLVQMESTTCIGQVLVWVVGNQLLLGGHLVVMVFLGGGVVSWFSLGLGGVGHHHALFQSLPPDDPIIHVVHLETFPLERVLKHLFQLGVVGTLFELEFA